MGRSVHIVPGPIARAKLHGSVSAGSPRPYASNLGRRGIHIGLLSSTICMGLPSIDLRVHRVPARGSVSMRAPLLVLGGRKTGRLGRTKE